MSTHAHHPQGQVASTQPPSVEPVAGGDRTAMPRPSGTASALIATHRRDVLIGAGGLTFTVGQLLLAVATLLVLLETLHSYLPAGLPIGHGLYLLAAIVEMAGLAVMAAGFFVDDDRRWPRLATGALLVALGVACEFAGATTLAVEYLVHHASGKLSASMIITALAAVPFIVGAVIAGRAFRARRDGPAVKARRDRLLAASSGALAGAAVMAAVAAILQLDFYSGISSIPGGYTTALGFGIAGQFIIAAGVVVGVVAFSWSDPSEVRRVARRDMLLCIAVAVAFVGCLVQFIAGIAGTSSGSGIVLAGKELAAAWLMTFQALAACGALVCAGIGFFLSARARGWPGPLARGPHERRGRGRLDARWRRETASPVDRNAAAVSSRLSGC